MMALAALTLTNLTPAHAAPPYVTIAVDGATGEVLQSTNPDTRVHPASLTKIMTLYILFEELEAGRVSLDSKFKISSHAAAQAPSKLGLKPGSSIQVRDAILALVTKSANDVAVAIAENVGGSEGKFARRMTETAQRIGMKRTVFRNASGLPNNEQITTARDMATLGRTIQVRFPGYYKFFETRSFSYAGRRYSNHNRLLGRVEGVDGIKTGYIRASGFNLVSSVRRGDRHVVAVIIGARSGKSRNAAMEQLLEKTIKKATPHRGEQLLAQAGPIPMPRRNPVPLTARTPAQAAGGIVMASAQAAPPARDPKAPLMLVPNGRGGFKVAQASTALPMPAPQTAAYQPAPLPRQQVAQAQLPVAQPVVQTAAPTPAATPQTTAATPRITIIKPARVVPAAAPLATASAAPVQAPQQYAMQQAPLPVATAQPAPVAYEPAPVYEPTPVYQPTPAAPVAQAAEPKGDYSIQIGAVPNEQAAHKLIAMAQLRAGELLAGRDPFTQTVDKNGATLWRARFAGFDQRGAKNACEALQAKDFGCFPVRN